MSKQTKLKFGVPESETTEVDKYEFEPIQGYPMLNWRGKRPFTSTQFYPAQLKESFGEAVDGWINKIYWGDNLQVMSHLLKEFRGKVDLVYIDPPFDSKADYKKQIKQKGKTLNNDYNTFEEKQYGDIWTNDEYLQFLFERLVLTRELLAENGTIYIHCDWHKSHLIRCLMDEVYGYNNFINEIIWRRGNNKKTTNKFSVSHDNIFIYSKSSAYLFNPQYLPYSDEYINEKYPNKENGRRYQLQAMYGKGDGPALYFGDKLIAPPPGLHWRWNQDRITKAMEEGIIVFPKGGQGMPRFKDFLDTKKGNPVRTIWDDLPEVNSQAEEREGYPTQKPISLLERIIRTSSKPGDIVFDCFMGSGTAQAVAMKLGRRFIGADINLGAIQISTKRLLQVAKELQQKQQSLLDDKQKTFYSGFEVYNVNRYDVFRNPIEAKELLIEALEIQPLEKSSLYDGEKDGRMVKIMPVNRIATRADLNELISGFDYKTFERRQDERPNQPVEKLLLVCMGHEADLKATLEKEVPFKLDIEVVDILRDKANLEFKRDSEARIVIEGDKLTIKQFYPMNLLQKLSLQKEKVDDWRELVESVMVDWNYDGAVLEPAVVDLPGKNELVKGEYTIPEDAGTIMVKITDLLSESLEQEISHG